MFGAKKFENGLATRCEKNFDNMFSRFDTDHVIEEQNRQN